MSTIVPERLQASLPAQDPRFVELREYLALMVEQGKTNLTERMIGEYALLGFLLTTGRMSISGTDVMPELPVRGIPPAYDAPIADPAYEPIEAPTEREPDPDLLQEERRQLIAGARSFSMFDD